MFRRTRHEWIVARAASAGRRRDRGRSDSPGRRRLRFEPLEDRRLLAITVDTLADEIDGPGVGAGTSLREAIAAATPGEAIHFSVSGTITLEHGELAIDKSLSIFGPGADELTIDADGAGRAFNIDDGLAGHSEVEISGITVTGGAAVVTGGGILNAEQLTLTDSIITGNSAQLGGGVYNDGGVLAVAHSTIHDNYAVEFGGGVLNRVGSTMVFESTISSNTAAEGGGIVNRDGGSFLLHRSTVDGNMAVGGIGGFNSGGGIHVLDGTVDVVVSTISGNSANYGGGIYSTGGLFLSTVTIRNSTISGNSANNVGGGIYLFAGNFNVEFSTITENQAGAEGDGIAVWADLEGALLQIRSTIVAGNGDADVDLVGGPIEGPENTINSNDFNAVGTGNAVASFDEFHDMVVVAADLALAPLADYGGPTRTHALLVGSIAIDAGDNLFSPLPDFDQRGGNFARVVDGDGDTVARMDIGAFEAEAGYILVDTLDDENDGSGNGLGTSLRDALAESGSTPFAAAVIVFDPALTESAPGTIDLAHGELVVDTNVTIAGRGANRLTVDAGQASRVLLVDDGVAENLSDVEIRGLTIAGGFLAGAAGGGGIFTNERLTVRDSLLTGNSAHWGGGIYNNEPGELTVVRSSLTGNSTSAAGAGIYNWGGKASIVETSVSGNESVDAAGILNGNSGEMLIDASTISGNQAVGNGGGILQAGALLTVRNSTISGNEADGEGGGIQHAFGPLEIYHSTITANRADADNSGVGAGGGIFHVLGPTLLVDHTIVAGNTSNIAISDDVVGNFDARYSLIGDDTGAGINDIEGNIVGTSAEPVDPLLGPLADNGGPTLTHALLSGSPAIDAGDSAVEEGVGGTPQFDQRGAPFGRVSDGDLAEDIAVDIGAFEVQRPLVAPALLGDYNQDGVVDAVDYTVWRNTLGEEVDFYAGADGNGNGEIDAGDYDVWKAHYGDTLIFVGSGGGGLGPIVVDTLADELDGNIIDDDVSLRDAIAAAMPGATIEFDPALFTGGPATLLLTLGQLVIDKSLTILGPGADLLTIDASGNDPTANSTISDGDNGNDGDGSRVFMVNNYDAGSLINATISGLTLTGGDPGADGGAIYSLGNLVISNCILVGNQSSTRGGAIAAIPTAAPSGDLAFNLLLQGSLIDGNQAALDGGGVFIEGGKHLLVNSTLVANESGGSGGGLAAAGVLDGFMSPGLRLLQITVSQNRATESGGGVFVTGNVTVDHSTIVDNLADSDDSGSDAGGGIAVGQLFMSHSIVANNLLAAAPDDLSAGFPGADFSLVETLSPGVVLAGAGNIVGQDPMLGPLADNGGLTPTHALLPGSPAIDGGDPAAELGIDGVPAFDQRGLPFTRVFGAAIDIGAYETQSLALVVDTLVDESDGDFSLGDLSLREAIELANLAPEVDTITFDPALTPGAFASIVLTEGELKITRSVTIAGPGSSLLGVDASGNDVDPETTGNGSRIFHVDDSAFNASIDVAISGLTLTGGDVSGFGGAILSRERLVASELVVIGNHASAGGGIALFVGVGNATIEDSTFTDNSATTGGGAISILGSSNGVAIISGNDILDNTANRGAGIYAGQSPQASRIIVTGNTISGNMATTGAGICLLSTAAPRTIVDGNTISGNVATGQGGGIFSSSFDLSVINTVLSGNMAGPTGGGIHSDGELTLTASTVSGNSALRGGGVYHRMGEMSINFSAISENTATQDGGGVYSRGARLAMNGSTITGNDAGDEPGGSIGRGGGLWISTETLGPATILDSTISDNTAQRLGGGLYFFGGDPGNAGLTLTNVTISGNHGAQGGGGIAAASFSGGIPGGLVTTHGGSITGNTAFGNGGGIYTRAGFLAIHGTTISGNAVTGNGGGVATATQATSGATMLFVDATIADNLVETGDGGGLWLAAQNLPVTILDSRLSNNNARRGGAIFRSTSTTGSALTVTDSTISGNTGRQHGGGIYNSGGTLALTRTSVTGNTVPNFGLGQHGGGIFNRQADLSLVSSSVVGNSAGQGRGGGINHENGDLTINSSTIANNFARTGGGGVWLFSNPGADRTTIFNSTLSGNWSLQGDGGLRLQSTSSIRHSTIVGNWTQSSGSSSVGGVSAGDASQIEIDHTIIAGNFGVGSAPADLFTGFTQSLTIRYTLIGDNRGTNLAEAPLGSPDVFGNLIGKPVSTGGSGVIDPKLRPLGDYGGPTLTHAPRAGSPILDAGAVVAMSLGFDQRGNPFNRAVDVNDDTVIRLDIGAVEAQFEPQNLLGDYNYDGRVDAVDYTVWRNTLGEHVANFEHADGDGDGVITPADYTVWKANYGNVLPPPLAGAGGLATLSVGAAVEPPATAAEDGAAQTAFLFAATSVQSPSVQTPATEYQRGQGGLASHDDALIAWLESQGAEESDSGLAADDTPAFDETDDAESADAAFAELGGELALALCSGP
jgi:predicted outer membrane repeat protein